MDASHQITASPRWGCPGSDKGGKTLKNSKEVVGSSQHVPTKATGVPWYWILSVLEVPEHNIGYERVYWLEGLFFGQIIYYLGKDSLLGWLIEARENDGPC